MEVQAPQSVQINFNNKIITLHNVTIVKNPKIITINASQYPNLLKGSQIKLPNANGTVGGITGSPLGSNILSASSLSIAGNVKSPSSIGPVKSVQLSNSIPLKTTSPNSTNNVIKQIPNLGVLQIKSSMGAGNMFKFQTVPVVKSPQSTVIGSPKGAITNNVGAAPMKVQLKSLQPNSFVVSKPPHTQLTNGANSAKVIISPPQKHKLETSPATGQPEAKKVCKNLPFCCIFCKDVYEDSIALIEHMKNIHPDSVKIPGKADLVSFQNGHHETPVGLKPQIADKKQILVSNLKLSNLKTIDSAFQSKMVLNPTQVINSSPKIIISPKMLENKLKPIAKPGTDNSTVTPSVSPMKINVKQEKEELKSRHTTETTPLIQPFTVAKTSPVKEIAQENDIKSALISPDKPTSVIEQTFNNGESIFQPLTNPPIEKIRKKPGRKPKYPEGMKPVKIKRAYNKTGKYSKLNPPTVSTLLNPSDHSLTLAPVPKKRGRKPKSLLNGIPASSPAMKKIQKTIPESMKYLVPQSMAMQNNNANHKSDAKEFQTDLVENTSIDSRTLNFPEKLEVLKQKEKEKSFTSSIDDNEDSTDDDSEVNDLLRDAEEELESHTATSSRSSSPESPEFEEVYPTASMRHYENDENEFDYNDFEYCSSVMEPICELSCEDDSGEENRQDENDEAMRLYREAMEMNYQANGIKKRGRRRKKVKPLMENFNEINGILAGLLEESGFKVPKGPGRGRRKEMNELELTMERINGTCLFSCNKCDETFKYAGDLAKHVRSHTINSPYQCTICQRKFTHIGSLNTHLRIHSGERPYKCNQCDKSFTQSNSLMVHVKSHLSNKPYQCLQCNKGFLNASSLALHQKTHTEPTAVLCPIDNCGKEFRDSNLLEEHMQTHKQSLLYQCSLCSEKFENSALLVQHVKTHIGDKPFQCNQCFKCFTQPGSLNTHLRIHTGEKPFKCEVCGKSFTQASSLSVHMKVHGEKEFKCLMDNCNRSFGQEIYLKKHMLKHIENSLSDDSTQLCNE